MHEKTKDRKARKKRVTSNSGKTRVEEEEEEEKAGWEKGVEAEGITEERERESGREK